MNSQKHSFKNKRIRIVMFSAWGSDYRQWELRLPSFVGMIVAATIAIIAAGSLSLWATKSAYTYFMTKYQEKQQSVLRVQYSLAKDQAHEVARHYADMVGIPGMYLFSQAGDGAAADSLVNLDGRGGAFVDEEDNIMPMLLGDTDEPDGNLYLDRARHQNSIDYKALSAADLLDQLESKASNRRQAYNVISERFEERRRELEHKPSVKPILNGRITDFFGRRIDPFVRRVRHHRGLDVAAERNTPVFAPAAGTIEMAKTRYRMNRGYGRVVIINHGYGMKTLYGHLQNVNVKNGQRVKRWDVIGTVGETGRATGPHLHYEVWVDGKARDPVEFIINE